MTIHDKSTIEIQRTTKIIITTTFNKQLNRESKNKVPIHYYTVKQLTKYTK